MIVSWDCVAVMSVEDIAANTATKRYMLNAETLYDNETCNSSWGETDHLRQTRYKDCHDTDLVLQPHLHGPYHRDRQQEYHDIGDDVKETLSCGLCNYIDAGPRRGWVEQPGKWTAAEEERQNSGSVRQSHEGHDAEDSESELHPWSQQLEVQKQDRQLDQNLGYHVERISHNVELSNRTHNVRDIWYILKCSAAYRVKEMKVLFQPRPQLDVPYMHPHPSIGFYNVVSDVASPIANYTHPK